ncbi:unnamed protein product [Musa acuminata subsp. malaccensis]|uniref:(wild Malaysian banana) hypothetical protein n=1 Tax=Musa acuminata subsp. malaccensis TaxID=214687 RepID=A0A804JDX7_MUSAM|nr:unnamed protein product [Musa acuminata subsp. malaccensis]
MRTILWWYSSETSTIMQWSHNLVLSFERDGGAPLHRRGGRLVYGDSYASTMEPHNLIIGMRLQSLTSWSSLRSHSTPPPPIMHVESQLRHPTTPLGPQFPASIYMHYS